MKLAIDTPLYDWVESRNGKSIGVIEEDHEDVSCPDGIESCKGHLMVVDWPNGRSTNICSAGLRWLPKKKIWKIR